MQRFRVFAANRWLVLAVRLILGACFLAASAGKIQYPDYFIAAVTDYGLLPENLAHLYGMVVPWVELIIGCALVLGIFPVIASWLGILLAYSFTVAGVFNLVYANQSACGCFGKLLPFSTPVALVIDIVLILLAIELIWQSTATRFFSLDSLLRRYSISGGKTRQAMQQFDRLVVITLLVLVIAIPLKTIHMQTSVGYRIDSSLESAKIPVLYFYTESCSLCKGFKPVIDVIERDYASKITVIRIDYDKSPGDVRRFEVTTTPTVLIIADKSVSGLYMMQRFTGNIDDLVLRDSLPPIK